MAVKVVRADNMSVWFRLQQLRDETQRRDEQLNHNTVVMMEMQDTIHNLQRELSLADHKIQQPLPQPTQVGYTCKCINSMNYGSI